MTVRNYRAATFVKNIVISLNKNMFRTYSIAIGAALILVGVLYGSVVKGRMETLLPWLRNDLIFDMAAIFSLLPYFILIASIFLFCSGRRIALYFLIVSIALPFLGMLLIAVVWKLFLTNLDLLLVRSFTVVFIGGSPFVGLLSLILLLPIFYQQIKKWGSRDLMIREE